MITNLPKLFLYILLISLSRSLKLQVDPLTTYLVDDHGRFIFYHGINSIYKQFPYYPKTDSFDPMSSLSESDFRDLRSWGMKAIRLFVSWEGFQPNQGLYNYTYLEKIRDISRMANNYGIDIILDSHQDLYAKKFCGEGFPNWLFTKGYYKVLNFPSPLKVTLRYDEDGNPLKQDCMKIGFFKYYISEDVMRFSHNFFTNVNGMADKFLQMWVNVIAYFKSEDNVIGYDLINQPSGANGLKNPFNFIGPGVNNNKYLLPFYKKLAQEIRKIDQQKLLLFEPSVADYIGGFYDTPSPKQFKNLDVLSYHTYCPFKNSHAEPTSDTKCSLVDAFYMRNRYNLVRRLKCGSMLTEFGSVPQSEKGLKQIKRVLGVAENNWENWFWWQFKYNADSTCSSNPPWQHGFYYPDGRLQQKKVKILSHPYAYAVCGTPISQSSSQNSYYLKLRPKFCQQTYTQIFLNEQLYFEHGFTVNFNPQCEQCLLQNVGSYRSYYRLIVPRRIASVELQIRVAGFI